MSVTVDTRPRRPAPPALGRWSSRRLLAAAVMSAWAALFWFLLLSGRSLLYLSTRTDWVVPVGAVILTAAALGRLASGRAARPEPLSRRDALGLGVIALPVVVVLALPPASLGTYAASRRSSYAGAGIAASRAGVASGELSLIDVAAALRSRESMRALVRRAGSDVSFVGFVARDPRGAPDELVLTRFLVSCCVADALSVQVRVVGAPPGRFEDDQWIRVTGKLYPVGREVIVDATQISPTKRPKRPYLTP